MNVERIDGVIIVSPEARLDSLDGPKLKDVIKGLAQEPGIKVVIDMGNTLFLDSSGCGGLVSSLKSLLDNNGHMAAWPAYAKMSEDIEANPASQVVRHSRFHRERHQVIPVTKINGLQGNLGLNADP